MRNITVNITITPVSFADWLTANPGQTDEDTPCPTCQGTGKTTCKCCNQSRPCPTCDGAKTVNKARNKYAADIARARENVERRTARLTR